MNHPTNIINYLSQWTDPTAGFSLDDLGFEIQIDPAKKDHWTLTFNAGFPIKTMANRLQPLLLETLQEQFPTQHFTLHFNAQIKAHQTQMPGKGLRGVKNTIAIASGKGGVGKSTVTVNLAIALAQAGARVGILDADIYGPSIPMMLGACPPVSVDGDKYRPALAHGIQAMSIAYLTDAEQALIWRGPMLAKSLLQMIDITLWDHLDYLLIDLPPGTGDIQLSLVQKIPLTAAIVVTTPQAIATLDAQKAIKLFEKTSISVLGLVENMSIHQCSACGHSEAIFGEGGAMQLSQQFNIPLLGKLPLDSRIRHQADAGQPATTLTNQAYTDPWISAAMKAAILLAKKPINYADKFPPIIQASL